MAGCMLMSSGGQSHVSDAPDSLNKNKDFIPAVYDLSPYGPVSDIPVGSWVTYQVKDRTITLAVVARETNNVWLEVIEEATPPQISSRLITPEGDVLRAYFRRPSDSAVVAQPLQQNPDAAADELEVVNRLVEDVSLIIDKNNIDGKKVILQKEDLDGRRFTEVAIWSSSIPPLFAGSEFGGLIQHSGVELLRFGTDARQRIHPPTQK